MRVKYNDFIELTNHHLASRNYRESAMVSVAQQYGSLRVVQCSMPRYGMKGIIGYEQVTPYHRLRWGQGC